MTKLKYYLLIPVLFLCGCMSPVEVSPQNPMRIFPWIKGVAKTTAVNPETGAPDYAWMYHMTAIVGLIFAVVVSWMAKRITKSSMLILAFSFIVSFWALALDDIDEQIDTYAPWVFGIVVFYGATDVLIRVWGKYKRKVHNDFRMD